MKNKLSAIVLSGILIGGAVFSTGVSASAKFDYGSNVNISGAFKYAVAWTSGTQARAKVSMHGKLSDLTKTGYVQTRQISSYKSSIAYIGHGEHGRLTVSYTK